MDKYVFLILAVIGVIGIIVNHLLTTAPTKVEYDDLDISKRIDFITRKIAYIKSDISKEINPIRRMGLLSKLDYYVAKRDALVKGESFYFVITIADVYGNIENFTINCEKEGPFNEEFTERDKALKKITKIIDKELSEAFILSIQRLSSTSVQRSASACGCS